MTITFTERFWRVVYRRQLAITEWWCRMRGMPSQIRDEDQP